MEQNSSADDADEGRKTGDPQIKMMNADKEKRTEDQGRRSNRQPGNWDREK
jgi:hypothetical protein